ncbi:hypothetical protein D0911_15615 [Zhongshania marina]|uniref:Uncharacterized protein n=1 Tax=Zhongshania marina TaxID=2304603 RepID=A0ABX9W1A2_9GAMM|nr:hypothetical protein D0911_15615 [Zhongshania marina]
MFNVQVKLYFHFLEDNEVIVLLLFFASHFICCNSLIPWAFGGYGQSLNSLGLATEKLRLQQAILTDYLVPDGNRPQRKVSLPDNTRPRMYCVKGSILDG